LFVCLFVCCCVQGYDVPTPIQRQAVPLALMGRDVIGIAKTGISLFLSRLILLVLSRREIEFFSQVLEKLPLTFGQ
jgi:hypothetical protein